MPSGAVPVHFIPSGQSRFVSHAAINWRQLGRSRRKLLFSPWPPGQGLFCCSFFMKRYNFLV
nr:MAG TPA: Protein of unknown function (DUF489) [Caudoviricetes sp.]